MSKRTVNNQLQVCDECGTETRDWHIHHKNCDHFDNRKNNLMWVCIDCHRKLHKDRNGNLMLTWSVEAAEKHHSVDTYDILSSPYHERARLISGFEMLSDDYNS